jgi:holin-like protein
VAAGQSPEPRLCAGNSGWCAGNVPGVAALALGWLPLAWCKSGARWLLAEMLLFFIPATVAVVQYPQLMGSIGLRIVLVILLSTVLVMTVTSLVVDAGYKFEIMLKRRKRQHGVL